MSERDFTTVEIQIMQRLLSADFPGVQELRKQLVGCKVSETGDKDNYGSIYLRPLIKNLAQTTSYVPVEAEFIDADGVPVFVLLHVIEGLLNEMEVYKADGNDMKEKIDPEALKVTVRVA